jgi:Ni/Fe-hydrogenase 1 B-type cytochrome subunit
MRDETVQFERVFRRTVMWRVFHWANALSIVVASLTGTFIADPFFGLHGAYVMAWMRAFHFYAAIVLDLSVISLAYLYFFSRVERGSQLMLPTRRNFVSLQEGFLNLVLLNRRKRFDSSKADSWNAMWFTVLHLLVLFQMFTGFQLYVQQEAAGLSAIGRWWPSLLHATTDWTLSVFGSAGGVRAVHLITMYFIIAWAFCHIYYEIWRTIMWKEGDIAIVFAGHKFARRSGSAARTASGNVATTDGADARAPVASAPAAGSPATDAMPERTP